MIKQVSLIILLLIGKPAIAQKIEAHNIEFYFNIVDSLEYKSMKDAGIIDANNSIAAEYFDKKTQRLNDKGFNKYAELKADIYREFYSDYHLLQFLEHDDNVYSLYFTVAGFDDVEFQILKCAKGDWLKTVNQSKARINHGPKRDFQMIAFNYDEGPKNLSNVRLFIKNDYLVMERSELFHTLYDLKKNVLLINEESPWHAADKNDPESMNSWIKNHLHLKIEKIINNASR